MRKTVFTVFIVFSLIFVAVPVFASDGMVDVPSDFSMSETVNRLEDVLKQKGMTIFKRISHSDGAAGVGIDLRSTELVIFGNPKVGSPLMKCEQRVAIDLPQKALVWKDEDDQVWISYNDPGYLVKRHDVEGCELVVVKVKKALAGITNAAAKK